MIERWQAVDGCHISAEANTSYLKMQEHFSDVFMLAVKWGPLVRALRGEAEGRMVWWLWYAFLGFVRVVVGFCLFVCSIPFCPFPPFHFARSGRIEDTSCGWQRCCDMTFGL